MSDLRIEPTGATLGAIVTGIDLANLDPAEWAKIEPAFHEYAVLIFPGQHLTDVAQTAFGARFGELAIDFLPFSNPYMLSMETRRARATTCFPKAVRYCRRPPCGVSSASTWVAAFSTRG